MFCATENSRQVSCTICGDQCYSLCDKLVLLNGGSFALTPHFSAHQANMRPSVGFGGLRLRLKCMFKT